jgi:7,8-dihydroneopterin aldolase/epimerase/oxygenase
MRRMERDAIIIRGLELPVRLGVPEAERAGWQTVRADVELEMQPRFDAMRDELAETLDYQAVADGIRELAAARPRKLLETLAAEIIGSLLRHPGVASAAVELRKRILPGVDHVAVRMKRGRS